MAGARATRCAAGRRRAGRAGMMGGGGRSRGGVERRSATGSSGADGRKTGATDERRLKAGTGIVTTSGRGLRKGTGTGSGTRNGTGSGIRVGTGTGLQVAVRSPACARTHAACPTTGRRAALTPGGGELESPTSPMHQAAGAWTEKGTEARLQRTHAAPGVTHATATVGGSHAAHGTGPLATPKSEVPGTAALGTPVTPAAVTAGALGVRGRHSGPTDGTHAPGVTPKTNVVHGS